MDKIICDICGTAYPESMSNCPVCGCSRDFVLDEFDDAFLTADTISGAGAPPRKKTREIFDYDEVNQEEEPELPSDEYDFDDEDDYEQEPRSNTALVVILLILIVLLLVVSGYFFVRYFLPNMTEKPAETTPIVTTLPEVTETETTGEPTIPCTDIVLPGGKVELGKGGMWLMNVQVYPDNTTDTLSFVSYDENVVTVTQDGTVTAVGEGQTTIAVTCGIRQILCNVVVDYSLEGESDSDGELPGLEVKDGESEDPTGTGETESTEASEETQPEETAATEETRSPELTLKLKKTDITIFARYDSAELVLDCDIKPEEIYWFTMDSTVAIVNNGVVTSTGSGITRIYGEYEGQRVECIVRCSF